MLKRARICSIFIMGFIVMALLHACAPVGPNYHKPQIAVPDAWQKAITTEMARQPGATLQTWWRIFDDPVLNDLIEQSRQSNLTLKIAVSGIAASRARLGIVAGQELPNANAVGSAGRLKHSDHGPFKQMSPPGGFEGQNMFRLGVDAMWEIDVFGRIRREIEAAGAEYEASVEDYRDVLVSLFAEVAMAYVDFRACQRQIQCAEANAAIQRKMLELTRERFKSGVSSKLDTAQAMSNLANTEAAIPQFRVRLNAIINRLAVLLNFDTETLQEKLGGPAPIPLARENIGIGVPADLLRQRPDIRMAEKELAAKTAMIGVATADLYPRFAISGFFGLETGAFSDLGGGSSLAWGIKSPVKWNFFSGGKVRSNITFHKEIAQQGLLKYEETVLEAMEEVKNAIVAHSQEKIRRNWLLAAVAATKEAVDLVVVQYETGLTDFNNVLDTQRSLFTQQDELVASQANVVLDLIRLYKALGGGWPIEKEGNVS
jgi:multidrug efflux system outer membrane protein